MAGRAAGLAGNAAAVPTATAAVAMAELADAVLASRRTPALAETIAERALLSLAVKARRSAA